MTASTLARSSLLVLLCWCTGAIAQDDPLRLIQRQEREGIDLSPDWRAVVLDWAVVDGDGRTNIHPPLDKAMRVVKITEFEQAQQTMERLAGDYGRLELLHGTPCFAPANETDSNLSVPVSVDMKNVSTWEALKTVIRLVNCTRRFGDRTILYVYTLGALDIPQAFDQERTITLQLNNVPAREAICRVLAQAPISVGFESRSVYPRDIEGTSSKYWEILIQFYRGNQPIVAMEFQSNERSKLWSSECQEAMKPAANCVTAKSPSNGQ